jgi:LAS superfamily LD-carboxypeptidase LdcB
VNAAELTGRVRTHVIDVADPPCTLHADAMAAFFSLRREARKDGFDVAAISSFRDFDRQLAIWNGKYNGTRPMLDADGRALDAGALSPAERVSAILEWSALPGASRHHWGTDMDLVDRNAIPAGYSVQLTPGEFSSEGPFGRLSAWLDGNAGRFGFFRPFQGVLSGVRAEPWHFSFAPTAEPARRALTAAVLREALAGADLGGKELVLARLEELHARYVAAVDVS